MVLETQLARSRIAIKSTISVFCLNSDDRQVDFKWATNVFLRSLICASVDSFGATDSVVIAQIKRLADRLDIVLWKCQHQFPRLLSRHAQGLLARRR